MADFGIDDIEQIALRESASHGEAPAPETYAARLSSMDRHASTSGSPSRRWLAWFERKARRVLHEIRRRRPR